MSESAKDPSVDHRDRAQIFLDKVSPRGTALSEADSKYHQQLLRECGLVHGTGDALDNPPGPRFQPLQLKPIQDPATNVAHTRRYALFAGRYNQLEGGWADHKRFGSVEDCMAWELNVDDDWAHIVDLTTGDYIMYKSRARFPGDIRVANWVLVLAERLPCVSDMQVED